MERQLWRLQDFRDGGGFGFWVEVFFLVTQQLFHVQFVGMFRAITSNWRQHKHSLGTQRVVLNLTCDLAIFGRSPLSKHPFPKYITDELLVLLENMVEGQSGSHIDDAMKELDDAIREHWQDADPDLDPESFTTGCHLFRAEAIEVIFRSQRSARVARTSTK
ncbi:hypothetical protein EDB84DRAFT_1538177 [Lactarius hengduanensis]|nr:hypothetical protein EDB84DRAFT_1538177 [Lactarius hengduanensis]